MCSDKGAFSRQPIRHDTVRQPNSQYKCYTVVIPTKTIQTIIFIMPCDWEFKSRESCYHLEIVASVPYSFKQFKVAKQSGEKCPPSQAMERRSVSFSRSTHATLFRVKLEV